jgi:glycosyltransferase involved in cell wall biosynthesis
MVISEDQVIELQKKIADQNEYIRDVVELSDHRLLMIEENDKRINDLVLLCDERLKTIASLEQLCADKDNVLISQRRTLDKMRNALTWRSTAFIRKGFGNIRRKFVSSTECTLLPLTGLAPLDEDGTWRSLTNDPQFLLRPVNDEIYTLRECWLAFTFNGDNDHHKGELFFDIGEDFDQSLSLKFEIVNGKNQILIQLPKGCEKIRFDPVMEASIFSIVDVVLSKKSKSSLNVLKYLSDDREIYYIGNFNRSIIKHGAVNQLTPSADRAGTWHSVGDDPYFNLSVTGIKKGWNMIEIELGIESKSIIPGKLYFDYGRGFGEADSENLIIKPNVASKRVIYIEKGLQAIRFDPMDKECLFSVNALKINYLIPFYAKKLIHKKLITGGVEIKGALVDDYETYRELFSPHKIAADYNDWILNKEKSSIPSLRQAKDEIDAFSVKPLISVVMPTYNTEEKYLRLCVDSVLNQYYSNLELCIADDNSPDENVRKVLSEYATKDSRVKLVFRSENGHISKATNSALEIAVGDFVALLDHDDELPLHALFEVAKAINENPDCNIIYSDEDKIDESGNRFEPHFKSGWNPDLLYSQNYISHLGVYRKTIIDEIKGFRTGVEGSQDYDLLLRSLAVCKAQGVIHISKVLYHWRAIVGSTALSSGEKSYTTEAGVKALSDYFKSEEGLTVEAGLLPNTYKVNWPIPKNQPLVSLIIPTYNGYEITKQAIDSILEKTSYRNYEILLVDNNSNCPIALEYFKVIDEISNVTVLRYPYPFNYSAINNFAAKHAKGSVIGLINNDIEVISPNWLTEMVSHSIRPEVGCVGAKLYFENDTIQHGGVIAGIGGVAGHAHKYFKRDAPGYFGRLSLVQNMCAVTAAVLIVRKEVFDQVGGLNEIDLTVAFNDVDFCLKVMSAGYRNLWTPYAELYHYESISRGIEDNPVKVARFNSEVDYMQSTWGNILTSDQYYNRNLTMTKEDFSFAL